MREIWKPVVGWEGWYEVSNKKRCRRLVGEHNTWPGRIQKGYIGHNGYLRFQLSTPLKGGRSIRAHIVVARAFLGPCPPGKELHHKDHNKENASLDNLEYVTHAENIKYGIQAGRYPFPGLPGSSNPRAVFSDSDVYAIRKALENGAVGARLAEQYGVTPSAISVIKNRVRWKHLPEQGGA